jgi:hypothetical protein
MLTLFTTPVIYLYLDRLVVRWARKHPHQEHPDTDTLAPAGHGAGGPS